MTTRVKVSLTCNKIIETAMGKDTAHNLATKMGTLGVCVQLQSTDNHVQIHVPSNQTCKRIGVQTVSEEGEVLVHTSPVLVTPTNRRSGKRQTTERVEEEGSMMTATKVWCYPDFERGEHFLSFGSSLIGALVTNVYNQGVVNLGDTRVELLPKGSFPWVDLQHIHSTVLPHIRVQLVKKVSKKVEKELKSKDEKIKELGKKA
jgi:hypothetical protein